MGLDGGGGTFYGDGLDDVRVECALDEPFDLAVGIASLEFLGFFGEHGDEFPADDLALLLGVGNACELVQEAVRGVHSDHAETEAVAQHVKSVGKFVLSKHAGVHENIGEAIAHGAVDENSGDGGIHAAAEGADGAALCPTFFRIASVVSSMKAEPLHLGFGLADAEEEIAEEFGAAFGVIYFDVELDGIDFSLRIFERGDGIVGVACGVKTGRDFADMIAVTIPDAERGWHVSKKFGVG